MDPDQEPNRGRETPQFRPKTSFVSSGSEFAGIGIQFALTILVFVLGGVWLDKRLHSSPWFVLVGTFVGAAGGFYSMYRQAVAAQRRHTRDSE